MICGAYSAKLWIQAARETRPDETHSTLPGATRARPVVYFWAITGVLVLLGTELLGEQALGIAPQQSKLTWTFAAYTIISAPVIEEVIFRGYLIIDRPGAPHRWLAANVASVVFALLHPYVWEWTVGGVESRLSVQTAFSTFFIYATSMWLYYVRLARWNPTRSLFPCIFAHGARNAGVVVVKVSTGYIAGFW
jgi:membrane protease YdiL (CAAX protease family)